MGLKQCPICELNYIQEDEKYCNVCRRNMKAGAKDLEEQNVCIECGDAAPLAGRDICAYCLNERRRREKLEKLMENPALIEIDVDQLNEIDVDLSHENDDLTDINKDYDDDDEDDLDSVSDDFEEEA